MIVLHMSGGLGNQMFQYAFGRATANRLGVELLLDLSDPTLSIHQGFELNKVFGIQAKVATESDMYVVLGWQRPEIVRKVIKRLGFTSVITKHWIDEPHFHFSAEMLQVPDKTYLNGYWQSEKYFNEVADCIRDEFKFGKPPTALNNALAQEIADGDTTAISLHVRRGDYVHNQEVNQVHGSCSLDYYHAAILYVIERVNNPLFYVFSDDIDWVHRYLEMPYPHKLIAHNRGESSYEDMRLMSLCKHNIIANSSFSWWGAWLNNSSEKIVVAPKNWFANEKRAHDLFPIGWVVL